MGESEVLAMVAPFMIDKSHPLAMVNDVFNAVFVTGNMLGDSMYYGRGAGKLPTASAVVSDVVDCARHLGKVIMCFWDDADAKLADISELDRSFYVRVKASAKDAAVEMLGDDVLTVPGRDEDLVIFSKSMKEKEFAACCEKLGDAVLSKIRLY